MEKLVWEPVPSTAGLCLCVSECRIVQTFVLYDP